MGVWRRRFIRFLGWWIAAFASLVAVLLLVLAIYLLFFDYSATLRTKLEEELSRAAGAPAHIGSINLDIASYAFELNHVLIERRAEGGSSLPPLLTVDRVWGRLRLSDIVRLRLHWTELVVQGLELRLVQGGDGGARRDLSSSPVLAGAGLTLSADRITLENALLILSDEEVPWRLEADDLDVELTRGMGDTYKGRIGYEHGVLAVKDRPPLEGSMTATVEISGGEIFVHEAHGDSALGTVAAKGKLSLAGGVNGRFEVEAEGDIQRSVATIFGLELPHETLEGAVQFRGLLTVGRESNQLEGRFVWAEGRVYGIPLANWTGDVFWDRQLFHVSGGRGELASGRARLQLHQPFPVGEHLAAIELAVEGASLGEAVSSLGERPSPIAAIITGSASLSFPARRPELVNGRFELRGVAPTRPEPPPEGAPESVGFEIAGILDAGDVDVSTARVETETMAGTVSGLYPREGSAELVVDVTSQDLAHMDRLARELRGLVRGAEEAEPESWGIVGRGRARGRLTGRLPHPRFEGQLLASELRLDRAHLESVEARAVLSRSQLVFEDLVGRRADGVVAGSGALALEGPIGARDFDLRLRFTDWPAADVAALLGVPVAGDGLATGDIDVRRSAMELSGVSELRLSRPTFVGVSFDAAEARAIFAGRRIRLEQASLLRAGTRLGGALEIDVDSGEVRGAVATEAFPLAESPVYGLDLQGWLDARAEIGGTLGDPTILLDAIGRDIGLEGAYLGDATIAGTLDDARVELDARFGPKLHVQLRSEARTERVSGTLRFDGLDAAPWIGRISESVAGALRLLVSGDARFEAALGRSGSLSADASVSRVIVASDQFRFQSFDPITVRYREGVLTIPTVALNRDSSRVVVAATVNLPDESLDVHVQGDTTLDVLETFYPRLAGTGAAELSARLNGSWERPVLSGHMDLRDGSLRLEGFPQPIGGLHGRLVFDHRTVRIPELSGVFGSGLVTFSGAISVDGFRVRALDLQMRGSDMRLRYPEGLVATFDASLALLGNRDEQVLSGRITLSDAVWSREYDLASGILSDREGSGLFDDLADEELFQHLKLDIAILAPQSLRLRNSLAEIDASAALELRGTVASPVLLGTTEAERGEVFFLGQSYDITEGKVDFVDPTKVEPFIELTAETRVRSYRVELRLTGTPDRFHPELSSDPPLRTVDILRLLSGASERDILIGTEEEELAGVGVASLLTERLSQELGRRAERLFGLDRFSIDPFLVGQIANPTARVSLGKQITRDLTINYSTNLNQTTEAIILIEYTPEGDMSWVLSRDDDGDVGIDVKFRKSF